MLCSLSLVAGLILAAEAPKADLVLLNGKVWTVDKLEKVDGIWTPLHQRMKALQDNSESEMELFEVKYNVELPDELFTRGHLLR